MKAVVESPKRAATTSNGSKPKRVVGNDAPSEFPLLPKRKSPKKKDSAKNTSKQHVVLPNVRASSITFAHAAAQSQSQSQPLDSGEELDVLKAILVREGYLQRLAHANAHNRISGAHLSDTVDLLDLLRVVTLDVVDAISAWRSKTHQLDAPYRWNNVNYLLKIPSDVDFLDKQTGLRQWLGFTLVRNPFMLPMNLDCEARVFAAADGSSSSSRQSLTTEAGGRFIAVGGKRRVDFTSDHSAVESPNKTTAAALADRKRAKHPYETRVLNDDALVPLTASIYSNSNSNRPTSRAATATAATAFVLPSQIGELDMMRLQDAATILRIEEARCGRHTRDACNRIVPLDEVQRQRDMVTMSGDAYATLEQQQQQQRSALQDDDPERDEREPCTDAPASSLAGKQYGKKRASLLGRPMLHARSSFKPMLPVPRKRSRGAQLEASLDVERQAHARFGVLIDALREEIERHEMDVAYYESLAGVQFYGDELVEFRTKTRSAIAQLRTALNEKRSIYDHKAATIYTKAAILTTFKAAHKDAVDAARAAEIDASRRRADATRNRNERDAAAHQTATAMASADADVFVHLTNQRGVDSTRALVAPIVLDLCATLIQKRARGMITRAAFSDRKIAFYVASTSIQASVRGFLVRRRVAKLYARTAAALNLQRMARGMCARRRVCSMRRQLLLLQSTLVLQKIVRGRLGRVRMWKVRHLRTARSAIAAAVGVDSLGVADLKELADACYSMVPVTNSSAAGFSKPLTPLVLGLVRVLLLLTSDSDAAVDVANVRWREAASCLRCSVGLLRRMKRIASAAAQQLVRVSPLGNALLDAYVADDAFCAATFERLDHGARAATALFHWITSFAVVARLQHVVPSHSNKPFEVASAFDRRELQQDALEVREHALRVDDSERRFVPAALLQAAGFPRHRPRSVLLVVAHDVPLAAKRAVVNRLCTALPGLFVVMNRTASQSPASVTQRLQMTTTSPFAALRAPPWMRPHKKSTTLEWDGLCIADIRNAMRTGMSVILETDVGLHDAPRRQFLDAFAALKAAIDPAPLCVLVHGSLQNQPATTPVDSSSPIRRLADAALKQAFEHAAALLHTLSQPRLRAQMARVSAIDNPAAAIAIVVEALIVIITPSKRFDPALPRIHTATSSYVSWRQLGKRLLAHPALLCSKLQAVALDRVPRENLAALRQYLSHADWPTRAQANSLDSVSSVNSSELLAALTAWIEAAAHCAQLVNDCEGLAPAISRTTPIRGLFDSVVTFHNTSDNDSEDSDEACVLELLDAVLADVRVYRTCHTLDKRRCVVSVYHDCRRIYLSAYDPLSSWRWHATIDETDVDRLLTPNAIERSRNDKTPPTTRADMYDRLVRLCLLQKRQRVVVGSSNSDSATGAIVAHAMQRLIRSTSQDALPTAPTAVTTTDQQLVVRRRAIRLYRHALHVSGRLATLTISELSRNRVQVDAFVHAAAIADSCSTLQAMFSLERILARLSVEQTHCSVALTSIPSLVLDRLHLFRTALCDRTTLLQDDTTSTAALKLSIRTREVAPGRLLWRKAVRVSELADRHQAATGVVWLCSLRERHATRTYCIEFYQPQTSGSFVVLLTRRDCEAFVATSKHATRAALQRMLQHFRFSGDDAVRCDLRRVLARFPFSIPVRQNPHQRLHKRDVVRTYVQVERVERVEPREAAAGLLYRICLPESCVEQTLMLVDSEVESFVFASAPRASWTTASSLRMRQHMCRELVQCFVWDDDASAANESDRPSLSTVESARRQGRVVAQLPSGAVTAHATLRSTADRAPSNAPASRPPTRLQRTPFTARSSSTTDNPAPLLSSCIHLLDPPVDRSLHAPPRTTRCYTYNMDESIHCGSYRVSGRRVLVQVTMRAVIVADTSQLQQVVERDAFELVFAFYDPLASCRATVSINGRAALREVVGPDRADWICAANVHQLMRHIVEQRTSIALVSEPRVVVHSSSFRGHAMPLATPAPVLLRMDVRFQRDRLFTKHKATPLHAFDATDAAANAPKLIDAAAERGVKVLTKTRVLDGASRVIVTVFDVNATQRQQRQRHDSRGGTDHVLLRVDAYVHATSKRLSLLADRNALLHVVGDRIELLDATDDDAAACDRMLELAHLVIDHIRIEAHRNDDEGSSRLFFTEYYAPALPLTESTRISSSNNDETTRTLLYKTTRTVARDHVVLSLYLVDDDALAIQCYAPRTSARCDVVVSCTALCLALGMVDSADSGGVEWTVASLATQTAIPRQVLWTHICSFVCIEQQQQQQSLAQTDDKSASFDVRFVLDEQRARACRATFLEQSSGSIGDSTQVLANWCGMAIENMHTHYVALRLVLLCASSSGGNATTTCRSTPAAVVVRECSVVCTAYSPSTFALASVTVTATELDRLVTPSSSTPCMSTGAVDLEKEAVRMSGAELLQRVRACVALELDESATASLDDADSGVVLHITLHPQ